MRCGFESRARLQGGADMTRAIPEKQPADPEFGGRADLAFATRPAVAPYQISIEQFLPIQRWMLGVGRFFLLRFGRFALLDQSRQELDRKKEKGRGVMFAGNFAHR